MKNKLEYIWLDGTEPTAQLRSKTKIITEFDKTVSGPSGCPVWGFDGSSTNQAPGNNSDCVLKPVKLYNNPMGEHNSYLVLCEVWNVDGTPHKTNTRYKLQELCNINDYIKEWVGFEQEYTLYDKDTDRPLGWPHEGEPAPQGDYYCGRNVGEHIVKEHINKCIEADISICGTNAEVMLGQWEYQIGTGSSLEMCDDLWVARWLMEKICDGHNVSVSLHPKPVEGDWNGAGCHTNFSTKYMREKEGGYGEIIRACEKLSENPQEHIDVYGQDNDRRLTGEHETCSIEEFRYGVSDRGASIRIPWQVEKDGYGYLEDRRPSANCDPYRVCKRLIETIC
jgi:glutamine synthetase